MRTASADPYPRNILNSPQAELNARAEARASLKRDVTAVCHLLGFVLLAVVVPIIIIVLAETAIKARLNADATVARALVMRGM